MDGNYYEFFWWIGVMTCGLFAVVYGAILGLGAVHLVRSVLEWWKIHQLRKEIRRI